MRVCMVSNVMRTQIVLVVYVFERGSSTGSILYSLRAADQCVSLKQEF